MDAGAGGGSPGVNNPAQDRWLERWLPLVREAVAPDSHVLELGCDTGGDTAWLVQQGIGVVATDISLAALEACAVAVPGASLLQHDLRQPLPFATGSFNVVIASLSLHYFDWKTTEAICDEVHRCLAPRGLLLCRMNSTRDTQHGAGSGDEIEPNYFRIDARYASFKRFFDEADLDRLFGAGDWQQLSRNELVNHRYDEPKVAWELVLRRV